MKTNLKKLGVYCTEAEKTELEKELKESGESVSNYFRRLRGWVTFKPGAPKGNKNAQGKKNAKGNRGRWGKRRI
jgi:hypothetical protein